MTTDLKRISQKTINLNNAYQIAIRSINDDEFPMVKVLEKATPKNHRTYIQFIFFGLVGFIGCGVLYIFILYSIIIVQADVAFIFSK